jgi:phosphohistidine phosphatase
LCSSATRAQATWEAVAAVIEDRPEVRVEDDLYGATAASLLARVRQVPEDIEGVLVVGHNPGLEDLAGVLAGDGDTAALLQLETKFPTGALATLTTDEAWLRVDRGSCRLESIITPRELDG